MHKYYIHTYVQVPHVCMYMYIYCTHSVEFAIHCWVSITEQWLRRRWFAAVVRMVVRIHLIQIHFFPGLQQYVLYIITVEKLRNEDVLYSFTCTVVHGHDTNFEYTKQHNTIQRHPRKTFQREINCLRWDSNPQHSAL